MLRTKRARCAGVRRRDGRYEGRRDSPPGWAPEIGPGMRIVNLWWGASRRRGPRLRAETKIIVIGCLADRRACGILSLCCLARVQVGRSKNLTPLSDPLFGVKAGRVPVVREECASSLKNAVSGSWRGLSRFSAKRFAAPVMKRMKASFLRRCKAESCGQSRICSVRFTAKLRGHD
jgi:hypothetical protein